MKKKTFLGATAAAMAVLAVATGSAGAATTARTADDTITGAGSSFVTALVGQWVNDYATKAITWTYDELDEDARVWLRALPMTIEEEDRLYVHSEAAAPTEWRYVTEAAGAERSLLATDKRLTFCGHIHVPQLYHMAPQKPAVGFKPQNNSPVPLVGSRKWLMVQGAVGQPRDKNPAAAYGLLNVKRNEMSYMRVPYDIEGAARKIHQAGLPQILAARLYIGR